MKKAQKRAGAAVPSANRITLLRDSDGDGVADRRSAVLLDGAQFPVRHGTRRRPALCREHRRAAEVSVPDRRATTIAAQRHPSSRICPAGELNHHWTKNVIASRDGSRLYVTVGSNSNVAENGMDKEQERAAILEIDARTGAREIYASGLRNPERPRLGTDDRLCSGPS